MDIRQFWKQRNKVLFIRDVPALGDILMHRMLFEDVKLMCPSFEVHFACHKKLFPAVLDHPFIDKVLDADKVHRNEYFVCYENNRSCTDYEEKMAPFSDKHRSDIWAENCGFELKHHNMHIRFKQNEKEEAKQILNKYRDKEGPIVLLAPISERSPMRRLMDCQMEWITNELIKRKTCPIGVHNRPIEELEKLKVPVISDMTIRQLMSVVSIADYVISVDTGILHCAGGLNRPLLGIFTYTDGEIYSKYYKYELVQKHRDNGDWDCGPCYTQNKCIKTQDLLKPCLTLITENMILNGIDRMFSRWTINTNGGKCQESHRRQPRL
jgi:ADP-heptose:LPS heptosyltransferase